jgi:hypothetical protein
MGPSTRADRLSAVTDLTPEARGPHLPDAMTRLSLWVYVFVAAAIAEVVAAWLDWRGLGPSAAPFDLTAALVSRTGSIAASLIGAALFLRHPDARTTLPLLVFAAILLTVGQLADLVDAPVRRLLESIAPTADDGSAISPASIAYSVFTTLLSVFAALYLGAGLAEARRNGPVRSERLLTIWLAVVGIAAVLISAIPIGQATVDASPRTIVLFVIGLILSLLVTLTWCYVLVVTLSGWIGGEEPRRGWGLAALTAMLVLFVRIVVSVGSVMSLPPVIQEVALRAVSFGSTVGWVLLLAAFLVGLPATTGDRPAATPPGSGAG